MKKRINRIARTAAFLLILSLTAAACAGPWKTQNAAAVMETGVKVPVQEVSPDDEEQIIQRDEHSWLIDGITPIDDVMRVLDLEELPHEEEYETLAGFLMVMLRRVPRRTDSVDWGGYRFEVMDVDSYRIDQVLVSRLRDAPHGSELVDPASALSAMAAVAASAAAEAPADNSAQAETAPAAKPGATSPQTPIVP